MIKVKIVEMYEWKGIAIFVIQEQDGIPFRIWRADTDSWEMWPTEPNIKVAPSFQLTQEIAMPLAIALRNQFEGIDDQKTLRKDYDAERIRVDKLLDYAMRSLPPRNWQ